MSEEKQSIWKSLLRIAAAATGVTLARLLWRATVEVVRRWLRNGGA